MIAALGLLAFQGFSLPQAQEVRSNSPWTIQHSSVQGRKEGDLNLQVLRHPVLVRGDVELRAKMALFWLDANTLSDRRVQADGTPKEQSPQDLLDTLGSDPASSVLREAYFEGPVEYFVDGELVGSATGFYLNLPEQRGWIANAELQLERELKGRTISWRARSEWLKREPDGTLLSSEAVLTPCVFIDQHLQIITSDLKVARSDPNAPGDFQVSLHDNSLRAYDLIGLPLPPVDWDADSEGIPLMPELKLGSSARFGSFIQTGLTFNASGVGSVIHRLLGGNVNDPKTGERAKQSSDGRVGLSFLGSRGVLLDLGLNLHSEGRYWWNMNLGGLFDSSEDRGLIRIAEEDRSKLRTWTRSRGRFFLGENSWLDLAISTESDPGVQSEFFERRFLNFAERENYLNWRQASGNNFFSLRAKIRIDSDRTQTEELPSFRSLFDRRPIASLAGTPLLFSSSSTLGWFRRVEGNPAYSNPFAQQAPFVDGLGNGNSLRGDTEQRLELPFSLGHGWKLTPYTKSRATVWDQGKLSNGTPTRIDLSIGARLTASYWKRFAGGTTGQIAPFLEIDANLLHDTSSNLPVVFDAIDFESGFDSQAVGLRSRFFGWRKNEELDIEISTRRFDTASVNDQQTLEFFGDLKTRFMRVPVGISHNGRYDLESGNSILSRSTMGMRPTDDFGLELSHSRALDQLSNPYYEAATVRGIYRWTKKWEFEASQTISILENSNLVHEAIVRRYGHDLVFEIGVRRVAGEGGTTLTLKLRPELLFRPRRIGYSNYR